jgi:hypothetical protein
MLGLTHRLCTLFAVEVKRFIKPGFKVYGSCFDGVVCLWACDPSPYNEVRFYYWAEEFAKGNLRDRSNPFGFESVQLNLPGMEGYNTKNLKLSKWNSISKVISGNVVTFVDDVRIVGTSKERCHLVHRQFTSRMQYLGIQGAPRKFRPPSQDQAGAWTGTIFKVTPEVITKSVSEEKWVKGKTIVENFSFIKDHPWSDLIGKAVYAICK